jgi:hypothetical protein
MNDTISSSDRPIVKQTLFSRVLWFGVGGGLSTALNVIPFELLRKTLSWPDAACYAVTLTLVTAVFAVWNFYLNFRTNHSLRSCTARYLACIALCQAINYCIVISGLKAWGNDWLTRCLIIGVVQVGMGGLKFLLYHLWVYPPAKSEELS